MPSSDPSDPVTQTPTKEPAVTEPKTATGTQTEPTADYKGKTAEGWHTAYAALQNNYNSLKTDTDQKIGDLTGQLETVNTDLKTARNQASQFEQTNTTLQETIQNLNKTFGLEDGADAKALVTKAGEIVTQSEAGSKAISQLERANLIITEYPELASWEAKGLLPTAEDTETLKTKLNDFKSNLGMKVGEDVKKTIEGASPDTVVTEPKTPDDANQESEDYLWNRLTELANETPFNRVEYNKVQARYDELLANKAKAKQQ